MPMKKEKKKKEYTMFSAQMYIAYIWFSQYFTNNSN